MTGPPGHPRCPEPSGGSWAGDFRGPSSWWLPCRPSRHTGGGCLFLIKVGFESSFLPTPGDQTQDSPGSAYRAAAAPTAHGVPAPGSAPRWQRVTLEAHLPAPGLPAAASQRHPESPSPGGPPRWEQLREARPLAAGMVLPAPPGLALGHGQAVLSGLGSRRPPPGLQRGGCPDAEGLRGKEVAQVSRRLGRVAAEPGVTRAAARPLSSPASAQNGTTAPPHPAFPNEREEGQTHPQGEGL